MEQKDYKLEIINELLKNASHIRAIAKSLKINHMMIVRKMNELIKENVVDYKQEGKNKVYFLKKNIEGKNHIYIAENYKLLNLLKRYNHLRRIIDAIQKNTKIKLAILFGSYAKNLAKPDSDIDIYIETIDKNIKKEVELIDSKISVKIGYYDRKSLLIKEIEKNHIIIKGVEIFYEKSQFFD